MKKIDLQKMFKKIKSNTTSKTAAVKPKTAAKKTKEIKISPKTELLLEEADKVLKHAHKYKVDKNSLVPKSIQKNINKIKKQMDKQPKTPKSNNDLTKITKTKITEPVSHAQKCETCQQCPDVSLSQLGSDLSLKLGDDDEEFVILPKNPKIQNHQVEKGLEH